MDTKKFRVVPCLLFTLAASLTVPLASVAQAQAAAEESVSSAATSSPTVTTFHFTDKGDDRAGRMTADAAGNFYVSASLDAASHTSGVAVLKYNFNGTLQGAFRYKNAPGEFGGLAHAVKVDKQGNIYAAGQTSVGGLVVSFTQCSAGLTGLAVVPGIRLHLRSMVPVTSMLPVT